MRPSIEGLVCVTPFHLILKNFKRRQHFFDPVASFVCWSRATCLPSAWAGTGLADSDAAPGPGRRRRGGGGGDSGPLAGPAVCARGRRGGEGVKEAVSSSLAAVHGCAAAAV